MRRRNMRQSHNQLQYRTQQNTSATVEFSRTYMKQVVAIHQAMFEKLLFDEDAAVSPDLAELFHDAAKTYLQISERINETFLSQHSLQD